VDDIETSSVRIPKLGLGTWRLTGETCSRIVAQALRLGYRHVDTAAMYDNEAAVGEGIRAASLERADVFVTTKVWQDDIDDGDLQKSAEASLERLGLDHVDLLLVHWPNPRIPLARTVRALCDAKARGLTRAIGVSNFPSALLEEAVALASQPIACNQVEYHPFLTQKSVLTACRKHGMAMSAYVPLARGRVLEDKTLQEIGAARGVSPAQIAIAWAVGQDHVAAIPKTASAARLEENLAGSKIVLSDDEMARISALGSPSGRIVDLDFAPQWDVD